MKPSEEQSRVNIVELKAQIVKKVGADKARQYFFYLNRLLSDKIKKEDFNKLLARILGRENLPLHNQLILGILKNASLGKAPPPLQIKEAPPKSTEVVSENNGLPPIEDGHNNHVGRPSSIPIPTPTPTSGVPTLPVWSNGDVLPLSPRKGRSVIRDRKYRDRPSPLGPNGKTEITPHQLNAAVNDGSVKVSFTENGDLRSCDFQRPVQQHQEHAQQPVIEHDISLQFPTMGPQTMNISVDPVHSNGPVGVALMANTEEMEQAGYLDTIRSPVRAPLGIPFCSASLGGAQRISPAANRSDFASCLCSGELCDTMALNKRMEQIARMEGLDDVSMNCSSMLNKGVDVYLKRLTRSCIELARARSGHEAPKHPAYKQQPHPKLINGIRPGHQMQMQGNNGIIQGMQEARARSPVSLLDFKVAMELNRKQLGEDWPALLEKISMHGYLE